MGFQISDGAIPAVVERFMAERLGVLVAPPWDGGRRWCIDYTEVYGSRQTRYFDWPHERAPTLLEAIQAVMAEEA